MSYIVSFVDEEGEDVGVERECVITVKRNNYNSSRITLWRGETVIVKGSVKDTITILNRASELIEERTDEEAANPRGDDEWRSM